MPEPTTYWNGEPARARRCVVVVPTWEDGDPPAAWWRPFSGALRDAVEVEYAGRRFVIDDAGYTRGAAEREAIEALGVAVPDAKVGAPGWGWLKVTEGFGGPRHGSASLPGRTVVVAYREGCEGCGDRGRSHAPGCRIRTAELARSGRFDD